MKSPQSQYHISERFFKGHVQRWGLWIRSWWRVAACCSCLGYQSLTARCSLIAAAVTGARITYLSELLSSAHLLFRRKSTLRSHHAYSYVLTGRPYKTSEAHTRTQAMVTNPGWAGFHLWVMARRVICLSQMDLQGVQRSCHGDHDCGTVWWRGDLWFLSFEVRGEGLSNKEVRLTSAAWLGLSH